MFMHKKLDLNKFKKLYVQERISDGKYELLSSDKSSGTIYKITGFGSLESNGYEHGFLYLERGSSILEHLHNNDVEIYRYISGDRISDSICLLGNSHKLDSVVDDTIIEYFKLNKDVIKNDFDINTLNKYLKVQALCYLWRIDKLLIKLSYSSIDLFYSSFEDLSYYYQLSIDSIENMYKIYFYKDDYLPYIEEPINLGNISFDASGIPYVIEDDLQYECVMLNQGKVDNLDNTYNDISTRQNKSLGKVRKNISD